MNKIVENMYNNDLFSQWLGIRILEDGKGISKLEMTVRPEMVNGFGVAHGAITFALADSALAFASNAHGRKAVSIETSINHLKPVMTGDILTATAEETFLSHKLGIYHIQINRGQDLVATFKGVVYRKTELWPES
jgi:acyl-CoA thioesterase